MLAREVDLSPLDVFHQNAGGDLKRISRGQDQGCVLSGLERADPVRDAKDLCRSERDSLQCDVLRKAVCRGRSRLEGEIALVGRTAGGDDPKAYSGLVTVWLGSL